MLTRIYVFTKDDVFTREYPDADLATETLDRLSKLPGASQSIFMITPCVLSEELIQSFKDLLNGPVSS